MQIARAFFLACCWGHLFRRCFHTVNRMRRSRTLAKIRAGQTVRTCSLGHYIPAYVRHAAHNGFDCIWLDLEHRNIADRDVETLLLHGQLHDIDIMVRPRTKGKTELYRYLEDGATGLMIPHVNTADQVRELVSAVKFPPVGDRGLDGSGLDADYMVRGRENVGEFLEQAARETFLVVQVETPQAIQNVAHMAAVPGLDGIFVGPADLGLRLPHCDDGLTLDAAMTAVAEACRRHQLAWGCPVGTAAELAARQNQGAQLLAHGEEFTAFAKMLQAAAAVFDQTSRPQ